MPIEIRELHIRMNVTPGAGDPGGGAQRGAGGERAPETEDRAANDELVTQCVEQVMELLRNRTER
jgi:hypothetical protein